MKLKVIGLAAATCFFIVLMVLAYQSMWSTDRPANTGAALADVGSTDEQALVLQGNEMLYNSFADLQKKNDDYTALLVKSAKGEELGGAEKEVSQAEDSLQNAINKVEISNLTLRSEGARNSLTHIVSAYRMLLKFQSFENEPDNVMIPKETDQTETKQMHNELQKKDVIIAQLQRQVRALQSSRTNSTVKTIVPDDYADLVAKNKYLDFDLRSVIKSNLALTKEYEDLKKVNQDLTRQLKQKN